VPYLEVVLHLVPILSVGGSLMKDIKNITKIKFHCCIEVNVSPLTKLFLLNLLRKMSFIPTLWVKEKVCILQHSFDSLHSWYCKDKNMNLHYVLSLIRVNFFCRSNAHISSV